MGSEARATADHFDNEGKNAVMGAAAKGHLDVVKLLANSHPASIDAGAKSGLTARSIAEREGHGKVTQYLLEEERRRAKFAEAELLSLEGMPAVAAKQAKTKKKSKKD